MKWSTFQQAVFDFLQSNRKNLLINSVAGSGKTTTAVEAAARDAGKVGIVMFNRPIADELKGKLAALKETDTRYCGIESNTFHSAGLRAINLFLQGYRPKGQAWDKKKDAIKDDQKVDKMVEAIAFGPPGKPEDGKPDMAPWVPFIIATVKMAKNLAFGVKGGKNIRDKSKEFPWMGGYDIKDKSAWLWMIYHYGLNEKVPDELLPELEEKGIKACQVILNRSNKIITTIDFADMVYLPLIYPEMKVWQHSLLIVDEAQDLNLSRILLAEKMGRRHIFIGDERQCIYGFTGALHDAMTVIRQRYFCEALPLSVCYRCARSIVEYAQRIVPYIQPAPNAIEGEVLSWGGDQFDAETLLPTHAILCRVNAPLVTLAFSLILRGIPCKIEGKEIGTGLINLINRWKAKSLNVLRDRLESYRDREIAKALAAKKEEQADAIADKVNTLMVLIERAQTFKPGDEFTPDIDGLKAMILSMFADGISKKGDILTLSSYHKSKGNEFKTVYLYDHFEHCPSKFAVQDHQKISEENLAYVAITRAEERLVIVNSKVETLKKVVAEEKEKVAA